MCMIILSITQKNDDIRCRVDEKNLWNIKDQDLVELKVPGKLKMKQYNKNKKDGKWTHTASPYIQNIFTHQYDKVLLLLYQESTPHSHAGEQYRLSDGGKLPIIGRTHIYPPIFITLIYPPIFITLCYKRAVYTHYLNQPCHLFRIGYSLGLLLFMILHLFMILIGIFFSTD